MDPRVTVEWLRERLDAVVVLDATLPPVGVVPALDVRGRFVQEHVPDAVFFDIEAFSDHATTLPHMLPRPEGFAAKAGALGLRSDRTMVVYEQEGVFSAPRAWWMLRVMGVQDVRLLQGGLRAWKEAGLPVETGESLREPEEFVTHFEADRVLSYDALRAALEGGAQVLDARPAGRFAGTAPEPRPGLASGHMPGAVSVPLAELVSAGAMKERAELCAVFAARGVDLTKPITTTCGSGVTAAAVALAAEICGAREVRLYDGSWAEYAARPDATIARDAERVTG